MMISQVLSRKIMNFMEAKFLKIFFGGGRGGGVGTGMWVQKYIVNYLSLLIRLLFKFVGNWHNWE